jgi:hypothetical protein
VLTLLKTYADMIALRKGPEAVPASWLILLVTIGMLLISSYCAMALVEGVRMRSYLLTFAGYSLGLLFYGSVIYLSGFRGRLLQALSAIIACGSIITMAFVAEYMLVSPLLGEQVAGTVATLIIFWSVPVEGHIIARAIRQHWFVGIVISMVAFILQIGFQSAFAVGN